MPACSYCKRHYDIPRGLTFVLSNGDILYFCSGKCKKNFDMGRKSEKRNWIIKEDKKHKPEKVEEQ
ncbi:MAG TPA: 50S ribosomal protein L24e [Candidatus Paceibacterota bacterium]|nr:50S ribosomal protein L24e [Candidatus Paceibacterota bacterium]